MPRIDDPQELNIIRDMYMGGVPEPDPTPIEEVMKLKDIRQRNTINEAR